MSVRPFVRALMHYRENCITNQESGHTTMYAVATLMLRQD